MTSERDPELHQTPTGKVHVWEHDGTESYVCGVLMARRDHFHTGPVTCGNCLRVYPDLGKKP